MHQTSNSQKWQDRDPAEDEPVHQDCFTGVFQQWRKQYANGNCYATPLELAELEISHKI